MTMSVTGKQGRSGLDSKRNRPCDACRRRKSKCVTEEGDVCVLCRFHDQQCTYLEAPQPRKRPANPGNTSGAQSPKRSRTIRTKPGTGVEEYDSMPGPSLLKRTLGLQNRHHSEFVGPNAVPDCYAFQNCEQVEGNEGDNTRPPDDYVRFVHTSAAFRIISDNSTAGYEQERSDIDEIEATALGHGPALVQLYFRIVHPSFPVLHKDVFLEKYARSYREFSPPLLAAVYLLASGYWSYSETLARAQLIDTGALQTLAFSAIQNTMRRPKLSTIQAGLLLSQYQKAFMGEMHHEQRDRLTVQLVNLAHGLGLHLDCSSWAIPDWEVGLRRRIGWALYMQDKWSALLESRPSLINYDDWEVEDLIEEDFPETAEDDQEGSSEVQRGRLVFMHMADLSVILSDVLQRVFSARSRKAVEYANDKLGTSLEQMKSLQIRLKDWSLTLPESLKMETAASMKLSSVGYLRLAYLTVEVCIHRNLLRTMMSSDRIDPTVAQVCRQAAIERFTNATDFVHRLQAQHLASFWYFISAKCCALIHSLGNILEVTAFSEDERAQYACKLRAFKWALKVNSEAGASFMKQALAFINQPVRVSTQWSDTSTIASPASVGYVKTGSEATPEAQAQWYHTPMNGSYQYGSLNGDYRSDYQQPQHMDPTAFQDPDAMFAYYTPEFDASQWMPNVG